MDQSSNHRPNAEPRLRRDIRRLRQRLDKAKAKVSWVQAQHLKDLQTLQRKLSLHHQDKAILELERDTLERENDAREVDIDALCRRLQAHDDEIERLRNNAAALRRRSYRYVVNKKRR
jgi:predicted  nucleic acid-binding Zn-ribbon protein